MGPSARPSFIAIAKIARTRGNRGEVLADLYTDFPARFDDLSEVWLGFPDGRRELRILEDAWEHQGRQVLKLSGTNNISDAEKLVGAWVEVDAEQAVSLPEGTYFDHELVGCTVLNACGEKLGTVRDVLRITGNNQLVVEGPDGEYLIPATASLCKEVSIAQKHIIVELPEGLMDLNK